MHIPHKNICICVNYVPLAAALKAGSKKRFAHMCPSQHHKLMAEQWNVLAKLFSDS